MEICLTSLFLKIMQIKSMRYHLTPVRMAIIKKTRGNKCQRECGGERQPLYTVRIVDWSATIKNIKKFHQKIKNRTAMWTNRACLVAQEVKKLPAVHETWVQSLGQEDTLEKGIATHSSILAWRIPWTEEPGRLQSMESQRVGHDWATNTFTLLLSRSTSQVNFLALSYERLNYTEGRLRDKNCTQIL